MTEQTNWAEGPDRPVRRADGEKERERERESHREGKRESQRGKEKGRERKREGKREMQRLSEESISGDDAVGHSETLMKRTRWRSVCARCIGCTASDRLRSIAKQNR